MVDGAIGGDVHLLVPWLRKPCNSTVSAPPPSPISSTSLPVEASPEGVAQMERDALGCEGACVGDGLGAAHDGFGLGFSRPKPMLKVEP